MKNENADAFTGKNECFVLNINKKRCVCLIYADVFLPLQLVKNYYIIINEDICSRNELYPTQ